MRVLHVLIALTCLSGMVRCSKKTGPDPGGNPDNSKVSYSIRGDYSGELTITYMKANGIRNTMKGISLPWDLSINPNSDVTLVYFKASTGLDDKPGKSGEKAESRLYIGGQIYSLFRSTANAKGKLVSDSLWYNY